MKTYVPLLMLVISAECVLAQTAQQPIGYGKRLLAHGPASRPWSGGSGWSPLSCPHVMAWLDDKETMPTKLAHYRS